MTAHTVLDLQLPVNVITDHVTNNINKKVQLMGVAMISVLLSLYCWLRHYQLFFCCCESTASRNPVRSWRA